MTLELSAELKHAVADRICVEGRTKTDIVQDVWDELREHFRPKPSAEAVENALKAMKWARTCVPYPSDCHAELVAAIAALPASGSGNPAESSEVVRGVTPAIAAKAFALLDYRQNGLESLVPYREAEYVEAHWRSYFPKAFKFLATVAEVRGRL